MLCPLSEYVHYLIVKYCYYALFPTHPNLPACIISLNLIGAITANIVEISLICCVDVTRTSVYILCFHNPFCYFSSITSMSA